MKREFIALLLLSSPLFADECNDYYIQWIGLGHREGQGVGFDQGYTSFSTFLVAQKDFFCFCPFIDLRVHVFNNGKPAGNFGFGGRTFLNEWESVAGVNLFYDFRKTANRLAHQIGAGFEWLGPKWDFFANAYIPVGPIKSHFFAQDVIKTSPDTFLAFSGNHLLLEPVRTDIYKERQFEFGGFDAFARRTLIDNGTAEISAEIGPYCYWGEYKKNIYGGSARLTANVLEYVTVSAEVNYDSLFRTTVNAQFTIQIPFSSGSRERRNPYIPCSILESKLARRADRREIIPVKFQKTHLFEILPSAAALDPSGNPYEFVFVNNTNSSLGTGTFENPFSLLTLAQGASAPGNIIYVNEGDGTTTGMDAGFTFQNFQQMYGSGNSFTLPSLQGPIVVPAMSANMPAITNTAGNGLTLANDNLVHGISIQNPLTNGIYGFGITNATITNNRAALSNAGSGIYFQNSKGSIQVNSNILSSSHSPSDPNDVGIYFVGSGSGTAEFIVQNNSITQFSTSIRSSEENVRVTAQIENNTLISPSMYGIELSNFTDANGYAMVNSNTIQSSGQSGMLISVGQDAFREVQVFNNVVNGSFGEGIVLQTLSGGVLTTQVSENIMHGNGGLGGFFAKTSSSPGGPDTLCLSLTNNDSDTGYYLLNNTGTGSLFYLEPTIGNIGSLTEAGAITNVPEGYCSE